MLGYVLGKRICFRTYKNLNEIKNMGNLKSLIEGLVYESYL